MGAWDLGQESHYIILSWYKCAMTWCLCYHIMYVLLVCHCGKLHGASAVANWKAFGRAGTSETDSQAFSRLFLDIWAICWTVPLFCDFWIDTWKKCFCSTTKNIWRSSSSILDLSDDLVPCFPWFKKKHVGKLWQVIWYPKPMNLFNLCFLIFEAAGNHCGTSQDSGRISSHGGASVPWCGDFLWVSH